MKAFVLLLIGALGLIGVTNGDSVSEDDGFRRLLRRASAEADRPLIREQRRNKDEDDEDGFDDLQQHPSQDEITRRKREEEDVFYHTLLARSESKGKKKRSFDTNDVDNKAGYVTNEDWTGDSKISNADRQELENLFQKLNTPDDSQEKTEVTRSTTDGDNNVDNVAKDYTSWLLTQPIDKMSAALTHKADIDHKLTEMFFETKRAKISLPKCDQTQPDCKCKRTCHPYTVARYTPCHCSTINPERSHKNHISDKLQKRHKEEEPHIKYPEPVHWRRPEKKSTAPSNATVSSVKSNCTTAECLCERTCSPKLVSTATPCECRETPADTKTIIKQGSKLCTDDSPKCLCTRACYPKSVTSYTPCNCDGDEIQVKNASTIKSISVKIVNSATAVDAVKPATPAKQTVNNIRADQRSIDPIARGWCKQACHPLSVAVEKPCKCVPATKKFFPPRAPEAIIPDISASQLQAPLVQQQVTTVANAIPQPAIGKAAASAQSQANPASVAVIASALPSNPDARNHVANNSLKSGVVAASPPGLFGTIEPIYIKHPSYQGCFKDRKPIRDLPKRFTRFDTTPEACISECKYQNYKFAGVQYGYLCFCGNAFGRYGRTNDQDCNSLCNGDPKRHCGAFWHNSVYSVDGREYDPSDFDFAQVDAEERLRDTLPAPAVRLIKKTPVVTKSETEYSANVATHLMKAAQAALKAAQKLLPSVSKRRKIHKKGRKHRKGQKDKREDDEEDEELIQEKMASLASLGAAKEILKKSDFGVSKREAEKQKRSIDEDSDPYDPDDGRDLLIAYLSNVALYNRQVRNVDDDEEEDDPNQKPNLEYRRMVVGEGDDGEFVEKYEDENAEKKKKRASDEIKKRSIPEESGVAEKKKRSSAEQGSDAVKKRKRAVSEGSGAGYQKKRSVLEGSETGEEKASVSESSGNSDKKKRSLSEGSGIADRIKRSVSEGNGAEDKAKRYISVKAADKTKPSIDVSVVPVKKKRSISEGSGAADKRESTFSEGSGDKKKRAVLESSGISEKKRRSVELGTSNNERKRSLQGDIKRSVQEGSGEKKRKRRSAELSVVASYIPEKTTDYAESMGDIAASLKSFKTAEKRDELQKEAFPSDNNDDKIENQGEDASGENESGEESGDFGEDVDDEHDMDRRESEDDMELLFQKRSVDGKDLSNMSFGDVENGHLKSDVEKGVDSLLNLVVELYKQQKTIKAFESSVRSLRHDILRELNVPNDKKSAATKKVRNEIEKTARERLHVLTSSIEHKITEFAKAHPEAKQANLAGALLPKLPLNDEKLAETKKEISRRAAELDDVEDAFPTQNDEDIPEILKEHFRRNAEIEPEIKTVSKNELSRMHRDIQDFEKETNDTDDEFDRLFN